MATPEDYGSSRSSSELTGLSILDNDGAAEPAPDDFSRQLLAFARDEQRFHAAVSSTVPAFRKARTRPGVALTLENLERNNIVRAQHADVDADADADAEPMLTAVTEATRHHAPAHAPRADNFYMPPPSTSSGDASSPSRNVPRSWGRKGRQRNDFLRRIVQSPGKSDEGPGANKDNIERHAQAAPGMDKDEILPRRTLFTGDVDWTVEGAANPLPTIDDLPDHHVSRDGIPHTRSGKGMTALDRLIELEREEDQAAAASILMQQKAKTSTENLRQQHEIENIKGLAVTQNRLDEIRERTARRRFLSPREKPSLNRKLSQESTNADNADGKADDSEQNETATEAEAKISRAIMSQHLHPRRQDSRDVLRQLARAASATPSPSSRNSRVGVTHTPVVVGAWVDTPAPASRTASSTLTNNSAGPRFPASGSDPADGLVEQIGKLPAPDHPRSALEALLRQDQARRAAGEEPTDPLGDTTMDSIAALLGPDEQSTQLDPIGNDASLALDDETLALVREVGQPVSQTSRHRQQELRALQRMNERLRAARTGVRDVTRGIRRVESQVEAAEVQEQNQLRVRQRQLKSFGDGLDGTAERCMHCGCPGGASTVSGGDETLVLKHLWVALRSPFYTRTKSGVIRPTFLGWLCLTVLLWSISELTLCEYYCHPTYAVSMVGFGVDITAPRIPFVTARVLTSPFEGVLRPLLSVFQTLLEFMWQIVWNVIGGDDAYRDSTARGSAGVSHGAGTAGFSPSGSMPGAGGGAWRMRDDEYV